MVLSTREMFMRLADSDDVIKARITPESFNQGLLAMGVRERGKVGRRGREGKRKEEWRERE